MRLDHALQSCLCLALSLALSGAAAAGERLERKHLPANGSSQRTLTRTGPNGQSRTWNRNSTWQSGNGAWSRQTTQTNPQGKTWSWSSIHGYTGQTERSAI